MKFLKCIIFIVIFILNLQLNYAYEDFQLQLSAKEYSKEFHTKREQQKELIRPMLRYAYEKKYKILDLVYSKFFKIMRSNNASLNTHGYDPKKHGFDRDYDVQEIIASTLENCCIAAESLLHFPDISYRIFRKSYGDWKTIFNWCVSFVGNFAHIIDESTAKLMDLMNQEVNEELRTADYVNPYSEKGKVVKAKEKRKLKKGPHLSGGAGSAIKHTEL